MKKGIIGGLLLVMLVLGLAYPAEAKTVLTKKGGVNYYDGHKETWYDLDMSRVVKKAKSKGVPGDYWENENGLKMYGRFVIVAADFETHPYGSVVLTSLGVPGMVLDTGAFAETDPNQIDIAVNWR